MKVQITKNINRVKVKPIGYSRSWVSNKLIMFGRNEVASLSYINNVLKKYTSYTKPRRPYLSIANYSFRNSLLGLKIEFAGRFSRAQRKYFSYHQKGRVPFNSFVIPIRTFCLPVTLKYGVSTIKIWVAYPPSVKLLNYAFFKFGVNYIRYPINISYFSDQTWFIKSSISKYLKNKKFKISRKVGKNSFLL